MEVHLSSIISPVAKAATAAPATMPDEDEDETGAPGDQAENDEDKRGEDEGQPEKILSVWCNPDGSYTLTKGDEDEDEEGEGAEAGGEAEEAGAEPDEENGEQHFPGGHAGEGQLLKAVLQTVRDYEAEKSGEGTAEDNFAKGYGEPAAEPELQKYNPA